ncbi:hypothetical protein C6496_12890 [Candidatus Poribacteria bacterium]|nr:MAG: hypothetical protein C6496_12890 [Candidatus Poribacteria bacterium]
MPNDYEEYSDAQLVQCSQEGDRKAGNVLCQRYWILLYRFFKKKIRGSRKENIEDLVQETFMEALKNLPDLQSPASLRAGFYRIARRVLRSWINVQEKQGTRVSLVDVPADEPEQTSLVEFLPAPVTDEPEHGIVDDELGHIRRRFERTLQPKELIVFRLRHQSSKTFKEIGEELGIKTGTAKVQYHRVVQAFKTWLKTHYPDHYRSLKEGGE